MTTCTQIETATISKSVFYDYPDSAFVRESQLVRSPKRPEHTAPLPFSAPTLWRKVADGTFPKPVKFSKRVTCWKVSEVRAWMEAQEPSAPHVPETNSGNTPVAAPSTSLQAAPSTSYADALKADNERLREALLSVARKAEMLKQECGDSPESPQAIRNGRYMHISYVAHAALKGGAA